MQLVRILLFYFEEPLIFVFLGGLRVVKGEHGSIFQFKNNVDAFIDYFYLKIGLNNLLLVENSFNAEGYFLVFEVGN